MAHGLSATLAYGYILTYEHNGKWDTSSPVYDEEDYTMLWPEWVTDPDEPLSELEAKIRELPVTIELVGNLEWDSQAIIIYANSSQHEAQDGPDVLEDFVVHSTEWNKVLDTALELLEITPEQLGPLWVLSATSY